jgi:hypothetical protein
MTAAAMVAEFDDVAGWTADAVRQLGDRYAIPARVAAAPARRRWPGWPRRVSCPPACDCSTEDTYALCRCGHSSNKPLCDGTHREIKFSE